MLVAELSGDSRRRLGRRNGAEFAHLEYHVDNPRAGEFYQHRMGYGVAALAAIRRLS